MAIRFLNQESDYLYPGSPNDSRLCHTDPSDQVQVWAPQVGQGYLQTILLQEGLSLVILDYTSHDTLLRYTLGRHRCLEFAFQIAGTSSQSAFLPNLGWRMLNTWKPQQRCLQVRILFNPPIFASYSHRLVEHLLPQDQTIVYNWADWVHRYQRGYTAASPKATFDQILSGAIPSPQLFTADQPFKTCEWLAIGCLWRPMTSAMHQVVGQILSCPYGGRVRRTYLERKALALVALKLHALEQLRSLSYPLNLEDLDGIYQAAKILVNHLNTPPSVEALARQVGLNRFKLNQGFHHVYGVPPFRYLQKCRLTLAQFLLTTSKLAIEEVAYRVGYTNRSRFATAFRKQLGVNPKAFQLQVRNGSQRQRQVS